MKTKRFFSILTAVALLWSLSICCFAADAPEVSATSALLIERNSGTVLYEKDADAKVYPASMTKIMTCMLAIENGKLSDTVTVSASALEGLSEDGSTANLKVGERMTLQDLLYCLMLSSANEAANVVAEYVSGSIDAFIKLMNSRAAELGCTGTHFANTHGLHDENHYTTARDLARITEAALQTATFRSICSSASYTVGATNLSSARSLSTTNRMIVKSADNLYYDSRVTGVKTGYTTPAGRCLTATAEDGTLSLLSVVCGCPTRILDSGDLEFGSFPDTSALLDYGFSNFTYQTVLNTLYPIAEIPVKNASATSVVPLAPATSLGILLPMNYDESLLQYSVTPVSEEGVEAPIAAGDVLGAVTVSYQGREVGSTELVAITDISRATLLKRNNGLGGAVAVILIVLSIVAAVYLILRIRRQRGRAAKRRKAASRRL